MAHDAQEDLYVRLEAVAYLASLGEIPAKRLFEEYLRSPDAQIQLESVIAMGELRTRDAVQLLGLILHDLKQEYFLRSAAAWALGNAQTVESQELLKSAFADVRSDIREEALDALVAIGESVLPALLPAIGDDDEDIAAGCAEVVRQLSSDNPVALLEIAERLQQPSPPKWLVWLAGHLNPEELRTVLGDVAALNGEVAYALNLLWSFSRSWIARRWELQRGVLLQ
jgi:HEAT repeat protein